MKRLSKASNGSIPRRISCQCRQCLIVLALLFGLNLLSVVMTTMSKKEGVCPSGDWILCTSQANTMVPDKQKGISGSDNSNNNSLATAIVREFVATGRVRAPSSIVDPGSSSWSLRFSPGKLEMSSVETLRHCYSDLEVYKNHFRTQSQFLFSISDEHKLMYVLIPKSGSSTSRYMMDNKFGAKERGIKDIQGYVKSNNYTFFTFVRDPLSRFYSQYDESYAQTAPWIKHWAKKKHPFPYLHGDFQSYKDYEDAFCPPSTRKDRKECVFRPTQENGTLTARLERFVREYDGRTPFDIHLHLQVPMMSYYNTGLPFPLNAIYNTTAAKAGWAQLAGPRGVVLDESLPPPCSNLYCRLSNANKPGEGGHLRIEPWEHPESLVTH